MQTNCFRQNKLAKVGEWKSGLKMYDFKHKLHTVFLNKVYIVKMLILPKSRYQFDSMQINILEELFMSFYTLRSRIPLEGIRAKISWKKRQTFAVKYQNTL